MTTIRGTRTSPPARDVDGYEVERRIMRALEGREKFTALDVDGQDVSPFLAMTDGAKIVNDAGLATGLVTTRAVQAAAITDGVAGAVGGIVSLAGATETEIATATYTTTGGVLEVDVNFHLTVWHPAAGDISVTLRVYRDATVVFNKTFLAINGDLLQGWQTPRAVEQPAAGTYVYRVTAQASTAGFSKAEADAGNVTVREFKR